MLCYNEAERLVSTTLLIEYASPQKVSIASAHKIHSEPTMYL